MSASAAAAAAKKQTKKYDHFKTECPHLFGLIYGHFLILLDNICIKSSQYMIFHYKYGLPLMFSLPQFHPKSNTVNITVGNLMRIR